MEFIENFKRQSGIATKKLTEHFLEISLQSVHGSRDAIGEANGNNRKVRTFQNVLQGYGALVGTVICVLWECFLDRAPTSGYTALVEDGGGWGWPRSLISEEQLQYLHSLTFTWSEIAAVLGVSRMTIYCRGVECGMVNEAHNHLCTEYGCLEVTAGWLRRAALNGPVALIACWTLSLVTWYPRDRS